MISLADRPARWLGGHHGRAFSRLTEAHFTKPFDECMGEFMITATSALMTGALTEAAGRYAVEQFGGSRLQ